MQTTVLYSILDDSTVKFFFAAEGNVPVVKVVCISRGRAVSSKVQRADDFAGYWLSKIHGFAAFLTFKIILTHLSGKLL